MSGIFLYQWVNKVFLWIIPLDSSIRAKKHAAREDVRMGLVQYVMMVSRVSATCTRSDRDPMPLPTPWPALDSSIRVKKHAAREDVRMGLVQSVMMVSRVSATRTHSETPCPLLPLI